LAFLKKNTGFQTVSGLLFGGGFSFLALIRQSLTTCCTCRHELYLGQTEEMMQFDDDYDDDDDKVDDVPMFDYNINSSEQMDEHMAALVLTSLSCSPASPAYMPGATEC